MLVLCGCIFLLILLLFLNKYTLGSEYKLLNHGNLCICVWVCVLLFHYVLFGNNGLDHTKIYLIVTASVFFFLVGFWTGERCVFSGNLWSEKSYGLNAASFHRILKYFFWLEVIRVAYNIILVYRLAGSLETFLRSNTYVRLLYLDRADGIVESLTEFILNSNALVGQVLVGISVAKRTKRWKIRLLAWSGLELLYAVVTMSKMCFVLYIIVISVTIVNNIGNIRMQKKLVRKAMPVVAILGFAFLLVIGLQRNYSAKGSNLYRTVFETALFYFSSGTEGMMLFMMENESPIQMGASTLSIIERVCRTLGIISTGRQHFSEFVITSLGTTNVYSWLKPFYMDYSYFGFIIMPIIFGIICGLFYNPNRHNFYLDVASSWSMAVVCMTFYNFLWGSTIYVFVIIYAAILHKALCGKLYSNSIELGDIAYAE